MQDIANEHGLFVTHYFLQGFNFDGQLKGLKQLAEDFSSVSEGRSYNNSMIFADIISAGADFCIMSLSESFDDQLNLKKNLIDLDLKLSYSYFSVTEVSEYALNLPKEIINARLFPKLPPDGMDFFCFYAMSKRRGDTKESNWYRLDFEERKSLMYGHGTAGRRFKGRVLQLITGSTGLDDYEWGVTLFATDLFSIKQCVYEMRFDEASSRFAEFGRFLVGKIKRNFLENEQ